MLKTFIESTIVSKEEYENMKKRYEEILKQMEEKQTIIDELRKDENVKKYINAFDEQTKLNIEQKTLVRDLKTQEMLHCNHYFVVNEQRSDFDGHRYEKTIIKTCIRCGLTNRYIHLYMDNNFPEYNDMNEVFINSGAHNYETHGFYSYNEMKEVKVIYNKFKDEYPQASDKDIEEHIALVKKMRGGKLC